MVSSYFWVLSLFGRVKNELNICIVTLLQVEVLKFAGWPEKNPRSLGVPSASGRGDVTEGLWILGIGLDV